MEWVKTGNVQINARWYKNIRNVLLQLCWRGRQPVAMGGKKFCQVSRQGVEQGQLIRPAEVFDLGEMIVMNVFYLLLQAGDPVDE